MEKIVFTAAIMDMCHKGHLNLLRKMREMGDKVIVVLHDDRSCFIIKDKFPIQSIEHRVRNLYATGLVDEVMVTGLEDPASSFSDIIVKYPNVLFVRGDDNMEPPGKWILDEHKIEQIYLPYTEGISSTKLREELCNS
jgi:cytidyltransferase-like protein